MMENWRHEGVFKTPAVSSAHQQLKKKDSRGQLPTGLDEWALESPSALSAHSSDLFQVDHYRRRHSREDEKVDQPPPYVIPFGEEDRCTLGSPVKESEKKESEPRAQPQAGRSSSHREGAGSQP